MKIGIITFHFPLNYGAVLQAYALHHCLELMGHEAEMIDYQPPYHTKQFHWQWKRGGIGAYNLRYLTLNHSFKKFCKKYLNTSRRYTSFEELQQSPPEADAYICGSDQIWCPEIAHGDPAYFLDFAPNGKKRIAYAGSFGKAQVPDSDKQVMADYFKRLDQLSSREVSGTELIKEMTGREAKCVLDPTLLIDDYASIITLPTTGKDYIVEIVLQHNHLLENLTRFVASETGLPVIRLNGFTLKMWKHKGRHRFPSPDKFLGFIKNAKYVVTNSFHGTVFSMIFKRPFFSASLSGDMTAKSVRMTELLQKCNLEERFFKDFDEDAIRKQIAKPIDWDAVHRQIQVQREASLQYLQESLTT